MIVGLSKTIDKYQELTKESKADIIDVIKEKSTQETKKLDDKKIDSIKTKLDDKMKNFIIPIPEKQRKEVLAEIDKEVKENPNIKKETDDVINLKFGSGHRLEEFSNYIKKYPESKIDPALDSLGYDKNFLNRFLFTRAKTMDSFSKSAETREQVLSNFLSYASVSLFILLPFFTLFLKFFYIRRKFTYVDHLIFVFHIQTVFFMLFSIFFILEICSIKPDLWVFIILFLLYLIIAMKKFYQQGYFKTFFKFLLLNFSYFIIAIVGATFVFIISFALF